MKIGILSSGGDCPGINATIRGVGKTAIMHYGMEVIGIHSGFVGLLNKDVQTFDERSLSGILNLGGTILGTSREKPFRKLLASGESEKPQLIRQNYEELALLGRALLGGIGSGPLRARGARRRGKQLQEATPPLCTGDYEGLDGRARKMFRTPREKREGPPSEPSRKRAGVRPLSKAARRRARCHRA